MLYVHQGQRCRPADPQTLPRVMSILGNGTLLSSKFSTPFQSKAARHRRRFALPLRGVIGFADDLNRLADTQAAQCPTHVVLEHAALCRPVVRCD